MMAGQFTDKTTQWGFDQPTFSNGAGMLILTTMVTWMLLSTISSAIRL
jgi:hypothetical protein